MPKVLDTHRQILGLALDNVKILGESKAVPDLDIIPRGVRGGWRVPYRAMVAGRDAHDVAQLLTPAIVAAVRQDGGWPWLAPLAGAIQHGLGHGDRSAWIVASAQVRSRSPDRLAVPLAIEEGDALLSCADPHENVECALATRVLERLARARLLAPARAQLIDRFGDFAAEQEFEETVLRDVPVQDIVSRIRRHPDGRGLRAPRSAIRKPTAETLDEPTEAPE